jgi:hypothetical protein
MVQRFGCVGALEGWENVSDIHTRFSCKIKKVSVSGGICWNFTGIFSKIYLVFQQKLFSGQLTCDCVADVRG